MNFELLKKLNDRQREAAAQINGAILILAEPDPEKCKNHNLQNCKYDKKLVASVLKNILAVIFTNKAAKEMQQRVDILIGDDAKMHYLDFPLSFWELFKNVWKRAGLWI